MKKFPFHLKTWILNHMLIHQQSQTHTHSFHRILCNRFTIQSRGNLQLYSASVQFSLLMLFVIRKFHCILLFFLLSSSINSLFHLHCKRGTQWSEKNINFDLEMLICGAPQKYMYERWTKCDEIVREESVYFIFDRKQKSTCNTHLFSLGVSGVLSTSSLNH